jgi:hypothetical protein
MSNEGKSATSFCCEVAALVPDMCCKCYSVKNHKIDKNSTTTKARKNKQVFEIIRILELFDVCLTKFKNNH